MRHHLRLRVFLLPKIMEYHFNKEIAVTYGLEEAIIIHNLVHWIEKNKLNKKHFHNGTYWTYNSISAFCELFPFWTKKQLERILKSLIDSQGIISCSLNKKGYDRTKWYAIVDEFIFKSYSLKKEDYWIIAISPNGEMEFSKKGNGVPQTGTPIPDSNTYSKPNSKFEELKNSSDLYKLIVEYWLKELHIEWSFTGAQGKAVKSLIGKIKKVLKDAGRDFSDTEILDFFKAMCQHLPEWYKEKDLLILDSKFNEIISEIKRLKNGKPITKGQSVYQPNR